MNWARSEFIKLVNRVFDKTYEEVLRIRKIADLEQQNKEVRKVMDETRLKWDREVHDCFVRYHEEGELGFWHNVREGFVGIFGKAKQYESSSSPYQLLEDILVESEAKINPNNQRNPNEKPKCYLYSCQKELTGKNIYSKFCSTECREKFAEQPPEETINPDHERNNEKDFCWGCHQIKMVQSYTEKNNFKYCSHECYESHCGEYCFSCHKRSFNFRHEENNPKLTYCLDCWNKKQSTNHEKINKRPIIYCRYCSNKTASILPNINWCQKKECIEKEIARVNNSRERERERERERAKLELRIRELEKNTNKTPEEQAELDRLKDKLSELAKPVNSEQNSPFSKKMLIGLSVVGVVLLGLFFIIAKIRKKNIKRN